VWCTVALHPKFWAYRWTVKPAANPARRRRHPPAKSTCRCCRSHRPVRARLQTAQRVAASNRRPRPRWALRSRSGTFLAVSSRRWKARTTTERSLAAGRRSAETRSAAQLTLRSQPRSHWRIACRHWAWEARHLMTFCRYARRIVLICHCRFAAVGCVNGLVQSNSMCPCCSLRPTVQPETSWFCWAKSTALTRRLLKTFIFTRYYRTTHVRVLYW